ncbi:MAG: energy transducer TonB [Fluviicola sp.]|jgi:protein TonB
MVTIFIITAIIAAISLYDYFSSRSWQMVTSAARNETVFENRNKRYGAYQIRRDYDKRFLLIFFGLILGVGGLYAANNYFRTFKEKEVNTEMVTVEFDVDLSKDEEPIVEPPKPDLTEMQQVQEAIQFNDNMRVSDTQSDPIEIPDGTQNISTETRIGTEDPFQTFIPEGIPGGTGTGVETTLDKDKIYEGELTEIAMYPGGLNELRKFIAENMDVSYIEGSGKVNLKFVVDLDGTISSVEVVSEQGDCEGCADAAKKVLRSKELKKWEPGKINGTAVRSYFRLPIKIAGS